TDARRAGDAVEVVLFNSATECVGEAALYFALELQVPLIVGALDDLMLEELSVVVAAALIVVTEDEEHVEERAVAPVALVVELVAIRGLVVGACQEGSLSGSRVAIGPTEANDVAKVFGEGAEAEVVGDRVADVAELGLLLALACDAVADEIVPVAIGAVLRGQAGVEILVTLFGSV